MYRRNLIIVFLALFAIPFTGYAQSKAPDQLSGKLVITGSSTMAGMIEELGKRFTQLHPGVSITVEAGGSGRGVKDALSGKADIGMASRELKPKEKGLFAISIARDGVAIAVHKSNPVVGVTKAQLHDIYTGKITNWKSVGGSDAKIDVHTRKPGHATLGLITEYLGIKPDDIKAAYAMGDNSECVAGIVSDPDAIGFLSMGIVTDAEQKGAKLKLVRIDGALAGMGSVRDGSWPLSRPLNLITHGVPSGLAKAFIEFALSSEARPVIQEFDYVPYLE